MCIRDRGTATTPSVSVTLNGIQTVAPTSITAAYPSNTQELIVDASSAASISSVVITVTNASYTDQSNYSNVTIVSISYSGRPILLSAGAYPNGGSSSGYSYSNNGTVTFNASAFAAVPPYPSNNSDTINGGGGNNTVVYRSPMSNYSIAKQSNGSYVVTSPSTAEGPDTLTNIQILQFSDQQVALH